MRTKTQWFTIALALAFLFTLPMYISEYWLQFVIQAGITAVAVLGLHILMGLCGQVSIGQAAMMAVGAYAAAIFSTKAGLSGWLTLPLSGITAGVVGLVFGAPSLRIKGFYLAMSTLAAHFIIMWCLSSYDWFGGWIGIKVEPLTVGGIDFGDVVPLHFLTMVILIVMTVCAKNIQRSNLGRAFVAIRDNERAAEVMGINLFQYKLLAFFLGCFYAGIAGWLWAQSQGHVNPEQFTLTDAVWFLGMVVIGGMGSTTGALFGTGALEFLDLGGDHLSRVLTRAYPGLGATFHAGFSWFLFGTVVLVFMLLEPRGLYHRWEMLKSSYRSYPYAY
ncbi:branched-chain amino acid ABC transporter permease [Chloroflexota bacterium]